MDLVLVKERNGLRCCMVFSLIVSTSRGLGVKAVSRGLRSCCKRKKSEDEHDAAQD